MLVLPEKRIYRLIAIPNQNNQMALDMCESPDSKYKDVQMVKHSQHILEKE